MAIMAWAEAHQLRPAIHEAAIQLLLAGNGLLFLPPSGEGVRLFRLDSYVIRRDAMGTVLDIVTRERLSPESLPPEVRKQLSPEDLKNTELDLFTHVKRQNGRFVQYQEISGKRLKGFTENYPLDASPWLPLRFHKEDGESYGRSYAEQYLGDLRTFENLSKAILDATMNAAKILWLVKPTGVVAIRDVQNTPSGGFVVGNQDDIVPLQLNKSADLNVAYQTMGKIEERLSYAFLLTSVVQRGGERVTATEIRTVASELETSLGGIYALLASELQLPLVRRVMTTLELDGLIPSLPSGVIKPTITTGVDALGRNDTLQQLVQAMSILGQMPEAAQYIAWDAVAKEVLANTGIETLGLIKSDKQLQADAEQQQQQQQQMMQTAQQVAPVVAKEAMQGFQQG